MSNIDKHALREEFKMMQECYSDPADRERQLIYIAAEALLDELEAAENRIAELEAREVTLPRPVCTYADHSYPAYSERQVVALLESLGIRIAAAGKGE